MLQIQGGPWKEDTTADVRPVARLGSSVPRNSPIPISTWQEARLIEAEAELNIGSAERAVALINEVRAFVALDPYEGDMSQSAVMDQLMYERSAELWLQAHRLYDLRRTNDPSLAGRDVCFEIGIDEWESNPNLGGS